MSDPCPGLSVRIGERKHDGPSGKFLHKTIDAGAKMVNYSVNIGAGVPFGIVIKLKEDFDFKGSEGVRIMISISDSGSGDGSTRPRVYSQFWYVDAMSKWRGRQVFHTFDEPAAPYGPILHKQQFIMPFPSRSNDISGVITVLVERGNLVPGTIPAQSDVTFEEDRRRSVKKTVKPAQFQVMVGPDGLDLVAAYEFCNAGTVDPALPGNKIERPQPILTKAAEHKTNKLTPFHRMISSAAATTSTPVQGPLKKKMPLRNAAYRTVSPFATKREDDIDLHRSSAALLQAVEKLSVGSKTSPKKSLRETEIVNTKSEKIPSYELVNKVQRLHDETVAGCVVNLSESTSRRIVLDPPRNLEAKKDSIRYREMGRKIRQDDMSRYSGTATTNGTIACDLPAMVQPVTYTRYGEVKQVVGKELKAKQADLDYNDDAHVNTIDDLLRQDDGRLKKSHCTRNNTKTPLWDFGTLKSERAKVKKPAVWDDNRFVTDPDSVVDDGMESVNGGVKSPLTFDGTLVSEQKASSIRKDKNLTSQEVEASSMSITGKDNTLSMNGDGQTIEDKANGSEDDDIPIIEQDIASIQGTDDTNEDDNYVMVDEPIADHVQSGGCVCS